MPGLTETLDLAQLASWASRQGAALSRLDYKPFLKRASLQLVSETKSNFAGQHAPDGTPWAPLKFGSRTGYGGSQVLRNTGRLAASYVGGPNNVNEISSNLLRWGSNYPSAALHQTGVPGPVWDGRPRNAKMLAIPLTVEAQRVTSPRLFPKPLTLVARKGHSPLLVEIVGKGEKMRHPGTGRTVKAAGPVWIIHYVLVPSVRIPARPQAGIGPGTLDALDQLHVAFLDEKLRSR